MDFVSYKSKATPTPQPVKPDDATGYDKAVVGRYTPTTALYLREHPRTLLSKILGTMKVGEDFIADGYTKDYWYHGSWNGKEGWTSSRYLRKV